MGVEILSSLFLKVSVGIFNRTGPDIINNGINTMELSEKDKASAVLVLQESLHVLDERIGKGENPLSGDVSFTVHERVKEMANSSKGGIENSLDCYRFLAHVFANMADRESRRKSSGLEIVQW